MSSIRFTTTMSILALTLCLASVALAQSTNSGDIRGTVTDASGAVVPGAKVRVTNVDTGVSNEYTTNSDGLYDTVSILPGNYTVTFIKQGFEELTVSGVVLQVGAPMTVDGKLTVGTTTATVEVTAQSPLLKTETGEQSTNLPQETLQELPTVGGSGTGGRDWSQITKTLPGTVGFGSGGGTGVSINGVMPYEANWLSDGGTAINPHSANVNVAMFESVAEIQIETSNYSAQYGTGSVVFNQISKGGTNQWHGSLFDFLENDFFNARSFFTPGKVANLRYDNYGGAVGGPIFKNRAFFFFNVEKTHDTSTSYGFDTVPTAQMEQGLFSVADFGPTAKNPFAGVFEPNTAVLQPVGSTVCTSSPVVAGQTQYCRTPFPIVTVGGVNYYSLTAGGYTLDPVALAVQKYFPSPTLPGYTNNLQPPTTGSNPWMKYFGRLDFQLTGSNRLTMSVTQQDNPNFNPSYLGDINAYIGDVNSYNTQLSDVWTISPTLVNEARMSFHREDDHYSQNSLGKNYPQTIGFTYPQANMFPCVSIGGSITGYSIGCTNNNAIYAQNTYSPGDTLTLIHGRHILHFGGEVLLFKDNDTPWGNIQPGSLTFSGVYTANAPSATNVGYADFLLGDVQSYSSTNRPINGMRETQPEVFVQDDFKLRPNLTINIGLRYQIMTGWREKHNQLGDFDTTLYNPVSNTLGAMWFAGNDGRNQLQANVYDILLPRVGFAWSGFHKMVIRGGIGVFIQPWSEDYYAGNAEGLGASNVCGVNDSTKLNPVLTFSENIMPNSPLLDCVNASRAPGAYNGQNVNYFPYNTPVEHTYSWSLSVERELTPGMVLEVAYVGNHAANLPFPVGDINQVPASELMQSFLDSGAQQQQLRPFPQFLSISAGGGGYLYNAISNYDSLQVSLTKRFARGLSFDANYTWSKMLSDADSSGWSGNGNGNNSGFTYQNANNPAANYGLSNLDRQFLAKADAVYDLPFGEGRTFLSHGGPLDWVVGGWRASGILTYESGEPYTVTMSGSNNSGALSGNWYPNLVGNPNTGTCPNGSPVGTINCWFNPAAFATPTSGTWGNNGRNTLIGPDLFDVDFSMAKAFAIPKLENGSFQIRLDATNIFNHPSFQNPNGSIGGGSVARITNTSNGGRVLQLGARFSF